MARLAKLLYGTNNLGPDILRQRLATCGSLRSRSIHAGHRVDMSKSRRACVILEIQKSYYFDASRDIQQSIRATSRFLPQNLMPPTKLKHLETLNLRNSPEQMTSRITPAFAEQKHESLAADIAMDFRNGCPTDCSLKLKIITTGTITYREHWLG